MYLRRSGIHYGWETLRQHLNAHTRVTGIFNRIDGSTLHVRKNATPEDGQGRIYEALGIDAGKDTRRTNVPVAHE